MNPIDPNAEWLEADGLGGFASGTVSGFRTRRYHALLLTATTPPAGRMVLANGFDAWVKTPHGTFAISSQRYGPDVIHPHGASRIESFEYEPWPRWRYKIDNDIIIEQELFVSVRSRAGWRMCNVSILRRRARGHCIFERALRARADVVSQFPLFRRTS